MSETKISSSRIDWQQLVDKCHICDEIQKNFGDIINRNFESRKEINPIKLFIYMIGVCCLIIYKFKHL